MADKEVQPIIKKVKKVTGHGAHGGVWKLAYADFVTAMMAFFLLMWLLNVTSEEMKSGLAQYFSPESVSTSTSGSGDVFFGLTISVDQPMEAQSVGTSVIVPLPEANRSGQGGGAAGETGREQGSSESGAAGNESGGPGNAVVVEANPSAAVQAATQQGAAQGQTGSGQGGKDGSAAPGKGGTGGSGQGSEGSGQGAAGDKAAGEKAEGQPGSSLTVKLEQKPETSSAEKAEAAQAAADAVARQAKQDQNEAIAKEIRDNLAGALKEAPAGGISVENVSVSAEEEGVMIEIGDTPDAAMFEIGKSVLQPTSTTFLKKIADVLKSRPEPIVIYGHTDGRQYPDVAAFTNWELSANRANEARRSLIASGVDAARIVRVVANADRDLKDTKDPLAARNRRIQILLRN